MHVRPSPDRRLAEPRWYHWLGAYAIMAGLWMVGILLLPVGRSWCWPSWPCARRSCGLVPAAYGHEDLEPHRRGMDFPRRGRGCGCHRHRGRFALELP
jgi:hypothetical protein